jgi:hypothetical protein
MGKVNGVPKDLKVLMDDATSQGWVITKTNGGHFKWLSPLGMFFFSAQTPSDHRALKNIKRDLRMYGFIEIVKKGKRR